MKKILDDASKSWELHQHLSDVMAVDLKVPFEDLDDALIIKEAKYVLEKYTGGIGFDQEDDYLGNNGPEAKKDARQNVKAIKAFLKKYDKGAS